MTDAFDLTVKHPDYRNDIPDGHETEEALGVAMFEADAGTLYPEQRRCLHAVLKHRYISADRHPDHWEVLLKDEGVIRSRLNDLFLELQVEREQRIAFKRQAVSETGDPLPSLLRDIGKLAVPEHILSKPGPLTQEEFQKLRLHPQVGAEIIGGVPFPYPVAPLILCHHERWDGNGYPSGLSGENIPLGARILSVASYFDALITERPQQRGVSADAALDQLRQAGDDVIATLRGELTREMAIAQHLLDRFAKWQLAADQALKDALDDAIQA